LNKAPGKKSAEILILAVAQFSASVMALILTLLLFISSGFGLGDDDCSGFLEEAGCYFVSEEAVTGAATAVELCAAQRREFLNLTGETIPKTLLAKLSEKGNLLLGHMEERCIALDDQKLVVVDCADNVSRKALCRAKKPNQDTEGFRENKSHRSKRDLKQPRWKRQWRSVVARDPCAGKPCEHLCVDFGANDGYGCDCYAGYELSADLVSCQDIDECAIGTADCADADGCNNLIGGYTCSCGPGTELLGNVCVDIDECSMNTHGCEHGCVNTMRGYDCVCNAGYQLNSDGRNCDDVDECVNPELNQCSRADGCRNTEGSHVCTCKPGYALTDNVCVDIDECKTEKNTCDQGCVNTNGAFYCVCNEGYQLDANGFECDDIDECATETHACSDAHACTNTQGSYTCSCASGYENIGDTCVDVDECARGTHGCGSVCKNTFGAYECACEPGYRLIADQRTCEDIDECIEGTSECSDYQHCRNIPGSYQCVCDKGFELDASGVGCVDSDECAAGNHSCEFACVNTQGSFECTCDSGYVVNANGENCDDVDECLPESGNCRSAHGCKNLEGSYQCTCNAGYNMVEDACVDINECLVANGGCATNCVNLAGSFRCGCGAGYVLDVDGIICDDLDECETGTHDCADAHGCKNTDGGYECTCRTGYEMISNTCVDIDECATNAHDCEHSCQNTIGSWVCRCNTGFVLDADGRGCDDSDECATVENICNLAHGCRNLMGSYECTCSAGYILIDNECMDVNECDTPQHGCEHACRNRPGSYHCLCNNGYSLHDNLRNCTDINECRTGVHDCADAHGCENLPGGYRCACNQGFSMIGNVCVDINECSSAHGCQHECLNQLGSYACVCNPGFTLQPDGKTCLDTEECQPGHGCQHECLNQNGNYVCACNVGYQLDEDGKTCRDIDECLNGNNGGCQQMCTNLEGSFTCSCVRGFDVDPRAITNCVDVDECSLNEDLCGSNAFCVNAPGSYECVCHEGSYRNGESLCTKYDECQFPGAQDACGPQGTCINVKGGYACFCSLKQLPGRFTFGCRLPVDPLQLKYSGCTTINGQSTCACPNGFVPDLRNRDNGGWKCVDVDECLQGTSICGTGAKCVNAPGSYRCLCEAGYRFVNGVCVDIDECGTNNPCPQQDITICANTPGGYECRCKRGYQIASNARPGSWGLGKVCEPIKECKTNSFGDTFAGLTNTSKSGWPCEPWVDVIRSFGVYQTEEEIYAQYPIVREAGSACRNPDFDSDGPWCYVRREGEIRFQSCEIPKCAKECVNPEDPSSYRGTRSTTRTGKACLPWKDVLARYPTIFDARGGSPSQRVNLAQSGNHCRFVGGRKASVACYAETANPYKLPLLESCDVPNCDPKQDENLIILRRKRELQDPFNALKSGITRLEDQESLTE